MTRPEETSTAPTELWYTRCPVPTASGIAQHYRWLHDAFADLGIGLNSIRAADERTVRDAHLDHTHPGMFREGGNIPAIWARSKGQNTAVVGITWVDEQQAILARPNSDIRSVADLRGRRLGVPKQADGLIDFARGMALHGLVTALGVAGLTPADAELVDISTKPVDLTEATPACQPTITPLDALLLGQVDAIYAKGAQGAALAERHNLRVVFDINAHPDPRIRINNGTPRPVTVDRGLALVHPDLVAHYLAVLLRAAEWAKTHHRDVVDAVVAETGTRSEDVLKAYGSDFHNHFRVTLSAEYVSALNAQKNFLRDWGFLAGDFDVASWIVEEPLRRAERMVATMVSEGFGVEAGRS